MDIQKMSVKGVLMSKDKNLPLAGFTVEAWDKIQSATAPTGSSVTDKDGKFEIFLKERLQIRVITERQPDLYFKLYFDGKLIKSTENESVWSYSKPDDFKTIIIDWPPYREPIHVDTNNVTYTLNGNVVNNNGVALSNIVLEILVKKVDQDITVSRTVSDNLGNYSIKFAFSADNGGPDLQVKAYNNRELKKFTLSPIRFNATTNEVINVILSAESIVKASEFDSVLHDVQVHLGQTDWKSLKEDATNRQITYLSNKTGWDARITAMVSTAHQIGDLLKIEPAHIYALLRAGVPANPDAIKSLSAEAVSIALKSAIEKNIIPGTGNIQGTLDLLDKQSIGFLLSNKPFASVSNMSEMLAIRLTSDQQSAFAQTLRQSGNDSSKLWTSLEQKGFSSELINKLQLDGKMGFLTGNNVPLMKKVYDKYKVSSDIDLVSSALYKPSEWKSLIGTDIPANLSADEYAVHLASLVKRSYPTAVAGERINRDEINLGKTLPKEEVVGFFKKNQSKYILGKNPVKTWDNFTELSTPAKTAVKKYERLYQISPSDEAMTALALKGISSAYEIAGYTKSEFLSAYGNGFPTQLEAELTYTKANEVYSASLGIATTYLTGRAMPNLYAITGVLEKTLNSTIAYPTLDSLFGNMDYCSCDSCKSVLSPAAYLVELLQFIDLTGLTFQKSNPIEVLLGKENGIVGRRPDIQHIQLTCENTNMALPYIDLVNEILEYYIIHGDLTGLKGHDVTEDTRQAELLSEPQFVNQAAYNKLKTKVYPYNLPFHQPLETLRRLFQMWGVTLNNALYIFSSSLSSRKELLGFSEDEYKTITNISYKNLPEYFGEPSGNSISQLNSAIANGKTFSRIVGVSYEDLVNLLKTNFINPGIELVPLFQKLAISLDDLQKYYTGILNDAQMDALIAPGISPADYGSNIKQWLRNNQQLIMGLVTLTDTGKNPDDCNFANVELRYALPDNTLNNLKPISYTKFHRFLRILIKTGWSIATLDNLLKVMLPVPSGQLTDGNIDSTFIMVFNRLANFKRLADFLSYSEKKYPNLLLILDKSLTLQVRQEQCAKMLKMSITEMIELTSISGIDPLADDLENDDPSLLKFVRISLSLKEQSLKVADLAYILHHKDITGKLVPTEETLFKGIKALRDSLSVIEKENSIAPDNADFNFAKSKMLLVYDASTTDDFFSFLLSTKTFSVLFNTLEESLPAPLLMADPGLGFDPFKKQLTYTGILSGSVRTSLDSAADTLLVKDMGIVKVKSELDTFIADLKAALLVLESTSNAGLMDFAATYPDLKAIYDTIKLEPTPSAQAQKLVSLILPELKNKLKINALQLVLGPILKADSDAVAVLTGKKENVRSVTDPSKSVLFDLTQLEGKVAFDTNKTYHFYIDIPVNDDYLLYISAPENTVISLKIDGVDAISSATVGTEKEVKNLVALTLKSGVIKPAELTIANLPAGEKANIWWRTKAITKSIIPDRAIYDADSVNAARASLIRLMKAAQLQNIFRFTSVELDYFASSNAETKDVLNNFSTDGSILPLNLYALWGKIELLIYFNSIKKENEPEDNTWVQVLKDPLVKTSQGKLLLESFNLWNEADITEILSRFSFTRADLSKLTVLRKVKTAIDLVTTIGYPAALVETWVTNDPSADLVTGIKDAIRNNVTEASWLDSMQSVSDPVRNLLRDALVSYIIQYNRPSPEIVNADKLYEYFLIDVQMDACMKTSRIRQAISTVQLFIMRCLINLEPMVDPASIKAEQWAWMKRYRVWEANRKVFLYPENWLEPELRDNKSSLFKELEGELLQAEVTDESAELAFLNYLKKLDDIAKLEVVGMYLEEKNNTNQDDDVLHVFGRTNGNTRQYYYRRYEYGYWTPWEKVNLNIEGEHLFPIVWRKRLFVFWINIFEKPAPVDQLKSAQGMSNDALNVNSKKNIEINMCWGEYYKGKWTSPKSTDLKRPMLFNNILDFDSNNVLIYGRIDTIYNPPGKARERVVFYIRYEGLGGVFTFTSKNAPPYLDYIADSELLNNVSLFNGTLLRQPYYGLSEESALLNTRIVMPGKDFLVSVNQPNGASKPQKTEKVLTKNSLLTNRFFVTPLRHKTIKSQYEAPLSYEDEHSSLFIEPVEEIFTPIWQYIDYYQFAEIPILVDIPIIIEKPVKGWPPEQIINPGDLLVSNPWEQNQKAVDINPNYTKVLGTMQPFSFGQTVIGTGGINAGKTEGIF